jgi:nascent polypeptide-associated complex subunit alpha
MFGGGGMNPRKMKQMMEQMGIDFEEIDAQEVVIRTEDEEYVFTDAQVNRMDAQGQQTYQVVGEPEIRERGAGEIAAAEGEDEAAEEAAGGEIPDSDVQIVAQKAGVSESEARDALEATNGDLAAAISSLE